MERSSPDNNFSLVLTGKTINCLNLGSYNYLGFADDWQTTCQPEVVKSLDKWPISLCSSRADFGSTKVHEQLEEAIAKFVGKEQAMVFSMGYGTNSSVISILAGPGSLIISDSLNHTSIVNGSRGSSAMIRVFKNNNVAHLEEVLREAIVYGQPKHHRPWKKIWVLVEGLYSMEGIICKLPEIVAVCKKYKAYLYVDEAHSIGALGATGRGVCEYTGVDPSQIGMLDDPKQFAFLLIISIVV
jgi:serine palmitoyltransferase